MITGRTLMIGAGLLAAGLASANAADIYEDEQPEPVEVYEDYRPAISWSGFYGGGHLGVASADNSVGAYGLHGGYNWQGARKYVVGIEGNVTGLDADDVEDISSIRGRIGFTHERALFYASAGLAHAALDDDFFDDDSAIGVAAGLGFDYKLNSAWSVGTDFSYYAFDDVDDISSDDDLDVFSVMTRFTFHFGNGHSGGGY